MMAGLRVFCDTLAYQTDANSTVLEVSAFANKVSLVATTTGLYFYSSFPMKKGKTRNSRMYGGSSILHFVGIL